MMNLSYNLTYIFNVRNPCKVDLPVDREQIFVEFIFVPNPGTYRKQICSQLY